MAEREEYANRTQGWVGVMKINRKGDEQAESVEPGGRVFLTPEEVQLTARVHRRREDSPFTVREIVHFDLRTGEEIDRFTAPLLEKVVDEPEETAEEAESSDEIATVKRAKRRTEVPA